MWTFDCRNVNDAYARLSHYIMSRGIRLDSRNGATMAAPGPVLVKFRQPYERVLFDEARDANPTFHLMEAVWMLAGARDVAFVEHYNKNMRTFSDDGAVFNAAYGHRWRHHFGQDQLMTVVGLLRANPNDRRAIISMWDAHGDLNSDSKDVPCNLQILPRLVDEPDIGKALEFTITNRSNDLVWGLCGANAVHMSFMQEWMAGALGVKCGQWNHLSNNLHIYDRHWDLCRNVVRSAEHPMFHPWPGSQPLLHHANYDCAMVFLDECEQIAQGRKGAGHEFQSPFLNDTVEPVMAAWEEWKAGNKGDALEIAACIESNDWRRAVVAWYRRRK